MSVLRKINTIFQTFGFNPKGLYIAIVNVPYFISTLLKYRKANGGNVKFNLQFSLLRPIFSDRTAEAGNLSYHYFHQDIWAAKKIRLNNPVKHYDIGSRLDGFISHLLTFRAVIMIDIRPLNKKIPDLSFIQSDATNLENFEANSIESLSSLHVIEHFGLGRYGDPVDPNAYIKVLKSMQRVLKPGGRLYLGTPIGKERLEFNSQRVFDPKTIIETMTDLKLVSFSIVNDEGDYIENYDLKNWGKEYLSCGLFEFTKE